MTAQNLVCTKLSSKLVERGKTRVVTSTMTTVTAFHGRMERGGTVEQA